MTQIILLIWNAKIYKTIFQLDIICFRQIEIVKNSKNMDLCQNDFTIIKRKDFEKC